MKTKNKAYASNYFPGREKGQLVKMTLPDRIWILSNLEITLKIWNAMKQANFINKNKSTFISNFYVHF